MAPRRSARIEVTGGRTAGASSAARRRCGSSRLGLVVAFVALLAQSASPGLHLPLPISSANDLGKLTIAFGAHALCLAPDSTAPGSPAPADKAPKADHDFAACCFWHGAVSGVLAPAALVEPVAFDPIRITYTPLPVDIATRLPGSVRAHASPAEPNAYAT